MTKYACEETDDPRYKHIIAKTNHSVPPIVKKKGRTFIEREINIAK